MNCFVRILFIIASLFILLSAIGCTGKPSEKTSYELPLTETEYKPLSAGEIGANSDISGAIRGRTNDVLLYNNPDRGFRTTVPIVINPAHPDPDDPTKTSDTCDLILRREDGRVYYNSASKCSGKHDVRWCYGNLDLETAKKAIDYSFDLVYFKTGKTDYNAKLLLMQGTFIGCNNSETLPQYIFDILDIYFDKCREKKAKVLFRYGYHGVQVNWQLNDENKAQHLKYGATEEVMIAHIKQFAPFITKNVDIIHKLSSGFIGSGGEQAYAYQYPEVSYTNVFKAAIENICIPNGLYYTVREPSYKLGLIADDPDYEYAKLIGYNNDAFYGEQEHLGWNSSCWQYNHNFTSEGKCANGSSHVPNDWWNYVNETAAYTPQSGEMFHNLQNSEKFISGAEAILQLAHHRYTTISQWNSYIEAGYTTVNGVETAADTVMQRWVNDEYITQEWLTENKIIYDPDWFYDSDGVEISRNPFEFVRDHLGYRLQAQKSVVEGSHIKLTLKNYGFAAAFCLKSGFAVLDNDFNVVSSVEAGNPDTWYSHDPEDWQSDVVLEHTVEADLTLPTESGKYYIAFYLKNGRGEYARFANDPDSVKFVGDGYSILHEFEIQ